MFEIEELTLSTLFTSADTSHLKRVFFDIEGSLSYHGDIIQLAYIITDWEFNIISEYNKYFRNFTQITEEEFNVHKICEEFLWANAGHHFSVELPNLNVFRQKNTMYITYTEFDIKKLNEQCRINEIDEFKFYPKANSLKTVPLDVNYFDAFSLGGKRLHQVVSKDQFSEAITTTKKQLHDAFFDVYLTYILCRDYYRSMK